MPVTNYSDFRRLPECAKATTAGCASDGALAARVKVGKSNEPKKVLCEIFFCYHISVVSNTWKVPNT